MTRDELSSENAPDEAGVDPALIDLERAAQQLTSRLALQNDDDGFEDDEAALRWRHALLRLSETFLDAAEERRDLSPILLGALHNALEQLLIHGEEADLMALEDWLGHEAPDADAAPSTPGDERRTADFLMAGANGAYNGTERRATVDRRAAERRSKKNLRRVLPMWHI